MKASTITSTWSLKTPSMPIRSAGRRTCSNCMSQPKQTRSKRWKSVVSPPVQSVWCRLTASMPSAASVAARRSGPSLMRCSRVELTSRTSASTARSDEQAVDVGMAQPQPGQQAGRLARTTSMTAGPAVGILEVERQVVVAAAALEQVGQRRDVLGQLGSAERRRSRRLRRPSRDDAVVVEHRDAVGGQPDVALQPGRAEAEAERERLERVLAGVGAGPPVGEGDRAGRAATGAVVARRPMMAGP